MDYLENTLETCLQYEEGYSGESHTSEKNILNDKADAPFFTEFKWEGKIDSFDSDKIYSQMYSVNDDAWDEVEIDIKDVHQDDLELIKEGALFNLLLGYTLVNRTRKNKKIIKFRRIILKNRIDSILDSLKKTDLQNMFETY